VIPGSKKVLRKILSADYNTNVEANPPPKPKSLDLFLQFRKEMVNSKLGRAYNNLPPQEGLYEESVEDQREIEKQTKARDLLSNTDFRILDFEEDLKKAKEAKPLDLSEDEEIFEEMESIIKKEKGEAFKRDANTFTQDFKIFDEEADKTHRAKYAENEMVEDLQNRSRL
jgi:predicted SpoU family rRNA methylase